MLDLTTDDIGERTALPDILDQIDEPVDRFIADGAYDGAPSLELLETRLGKNVAIIIPRPRLPYGVRNHHSIHWLKIVISQTSRPLVSWFGKK